MQSILPGRCCGMNFLPVCCCMWRCCAVMQSRVCICHWCCCAGVCPNRKCCMLWIKSFHVIFMVTWFAGLFYLPRLFVYHAMSSDSTSIERFKIMERKLYFGIMTPGAVLT